jgi:D-3-phosphoglycerate dehydrogenase
MKEKFLVLSDTPDFFIRDLEKLGFKVETNAQPDYQHVLEKINDFTGVLVRSGIKLDKNLIEKAGNLKYILRPGSGLDIIDLESARNKNIIVINSPEGNANAVAEHALGMLLSCVNKIPESFEEVKNYVWDRHKNTGHELMSKTIGVIGYGNTGSAFVKKLSALDVKIFVYDKYKSGFEKSWFLETNMDAIFENADIVSFHIPLNKETRNLINKEFLDKFEKQILLINTSRGKILNTKDLLEAIQNRKVSKACLDVLENENPATFNKEETIVFDNLLKTKKVLITPHIAGKTSQSEEKIFSVLIEKLRKII